MKKSNFLLGLAVILFILAASPSPGAETDTAVRNDRMKKLMERVFTNSTGSSISYDTRPNAFLMEMVKDIPPGKALDVGMGQGRNALFLARQGWDVTGFDLSPTGVALARQSAAKERVPLTAITATDEEFDFGTNRWDLVVLCYVDFRKIMPRIWKSLKPGGVVVVEYYHRDTRRYRPMNDEKSFASNELLNLFSDYRILRYEDTSARPDWIYTENEKHRVVRLLAQKEDRNASNVCYSEGKTYAPGIELCRGGRKQKCEQSGWISRGRCK